MRRPSAAVVGGALEWMRLLRFHSRSGAREVLRQGGPRGLTATQLDLALDWLIDLGVVGADGALRTEVPASARGDGYWLLAQVLNVEQPPWLHDADDLLPTPDDLPLDFLELGLALSVPDAECLRLVHAASGKVDARAREALGALGEELLVAYLDRYDHLQVEHVSLTSDSYGFDVLVRTASGAWHLEVKSARDRPSARFFLSRNEANVMQQDDAWRLVVLGISSDDTLAAVGTAGNDRLRDCLPTDRSAAARWESVRITFPRSQLLAGIPELGVLDVATTGAR